MKPRQKQLIQASFQKIILIDETAAANFYGCLFELDPGLRQLLRGNGIKSSQAFTQLLSMAVKGLDHFNELIPAVRVMGIRYAACGVRNHHYELVAAALFRTLEQSLGADFTREVREAWAVMYFLLTQTMKNAVTAAAMSGGRCLARAAAR